MIKFVMIAAAGGLGALARYALGGLVHRLMGEGFAWGTMAVNILGSFLFGLVWALATERAVMSPETRLIILTGFMGSFTTFSTFMFETGQMIKAGQYLLAGGNLVLSAAIGLLALWAGVASAKLI